MDDENGDTVTRTRTITSTTFGDYEFAGYGPLNSDEEDIWTTVFLAETCRASEAETADRVERAVDLAEEATDAYRARMAASKRAELAATEACQGV